ncbi:3'-5' exonuclease [Cytobacillus horneckiae]|uniref:exonuclease domain-containing protein n=1 Tax=Cytobacillus horneckiae TaxID=549687 RepID=UPI0034CEAB3C
MDTKIIFDLEATCEDKSFDPNFDLETIEIGAIKIIENKIVDEYQTFIKPVRTPKLTNYCKELTSITQEQVDNGQSFQDAILEFQKWAGNEAEYLSWGYYDRKQFEKDCFYHSLDIEWLKKHRSIKHEYQTLKKLQRAIGVKKALKLEGIEFEGVHHRGIDDARNIAKIYLSAFPLQESRPNTIGKLDSQDDPFCIYKHDWDNTFQT